jgi:uncharacterized protein
MKRAEAMTRLRREADAVKALGATSLYLFGSTVRNEAGPAGDLDLFVEYDQAAKFSLIELVAIKQLLEERLAVPVDVTTRDSLHPLLKDDIERTAERVF